MFFRPDLINIMRGLTFGVGSNPKVFSTAPPHPALKARITFCAVDNGGPAANKKGLGKCIPKNVVSRLVIFALAK